MKSASILIWILRITAAVIMLQTLAYKFTASPESVYIFTTLGIEPFGRIGTGVLELIASILLLVPRTSWFGALMGLGLMVGAIFSHVFVLGIHVMDDGGKLFALAVITLVCCTAVLYSARHEVMAFVAGFMKKSVA